MPEIAYVNGEFSSVEEAVIPIEDRGFQFADGVYEVAVAHRDRVFQLEEHLGRLKRSLEGIGLAVDLHEHRIREVIAEGISRAGFEHTMVYLQITRGVCPRSHSYPESVTPTVVATFKPKPVIEPARRDRGLSVITVPEIRWAYCYIKSIALLPSIIAKNDALRRGYDDAIFVTASGEVREATASNVFAVCNGVLRTPAQTDAILHGITRSYVLQCAKRIDLPCEESPLMVEELRAADEAFLSSTTIDVLAVTKLDDAPIGNGRPGPVTSALFEQFSAGIAEDCAPLAHNSA